MPKKIEVISEKEYWELKAKSEKEKKEFIAKNARYTGELRA